MNNGYVSTSSPVSRAIEANDKTIRSEQRALRKGSVTRVDNAIKAIELVGKLSIYNPTQAQWFAMLNALRSAVDDAEKQFKSIQPRQITFSLE